MQHDVNLHKHMADNGIHCEAPVQILGAVIPDDVPRKRDIGLAQMVDYEFIYGPSPLVEPAACKRIGNLSNQSLHLGHQPDLGGSIEVLACDPFQCVYVLIELVKLAVLFKVNMEVVERTQYLVWSCPHLVKAKVQRLDGRRFPHKVQPNKIYRVV